MQKENDDSPVPGVPADVDDSSPIAVRDEPLPPVVPDPATLIRGFRLLAQRIPEFTQLSREEERAMIRASALPPEMIADGLVAAEVWDQSRIWTRMTPEELRELDREIREGDEVEKALTILLKGVAGANRKRKYRRGKAILALYRGLKITLDPPSESDNHLLPYFENMQRAYMKNRKRRKGKDEEPEE
jgi:hypothetical protein